MGPVSASALKDNRADLAALSDPLKDAEVWDLTAFGDLRCMEKSSDHSPI